MNEFEHVSMNTDRELFREVAGDYYSPSVFVTEVGSIGMNAGGTVIVMPIKQWHDLASCKLPRFRTMELPSLTD